MYYFSVTFRSMSCAVYIFVKFVFHCKMQFLIVLLYFIRNHPRVKAIDMMQAGNLQNSSASDIKKKIEDGKKRDEQLARSIS